MKVLFFPSNFQGVRKISALLVCMLFVFVFVVSPIKVKAEAFPIPPLWLPMNPYNAQGLEGNYVLLNDDQKKIVHEVIGAANSVYLGMGGYVLTNPILGVQATRQFYQEYGSSFLNTFWTQIMGTSRAMTDFVGSTIYKASTYNTYAEYEADTAPTVESSNHKYFQISPELTVAFKNWYRINGGVEDWQLSTKPFESDIAWDIRNFNQANYNYIVSNLSSYSDTLVKVNYTNTGSNLSCLLVTFNQEYNLFVNQTKGKIYVVDVNGNQVNSITYAHWGFIRNGGTYVDADGGMNSAIFTTPLNCNESIYNTNLTVLEQVQSFMDDGYSISSSRSMHLIPSTLIKHVYAGFSWSEKHEVYNIDDLNIGNADSQYIQNIDDVGYVDINILIGQIADEVINLREVVEESVLVKDGDTAIPYADSLQVAIDKYINQPESGVVIPVDIFGGLTGVNGPVSYLWYMTKPLVSYTGDLLGLLILDGDGTFQFTGLGYIVVGVVTVGIIGGLVTKCLL